MEKEDTRHVLALDLGSTRFKAGKLTLNHVLHPVVSVDTPPLSGDGMEREGDAEAYRDAAEQALRKVVGAPSWRGKLGLTSQRSSCLFWSKEDGKPATPLVSWQDRRAAEWCDANAQAKAWVTRRTGLPLSPYYVGPKVAVLLQDHDLSDQVRSGELFLGTLDTYLIWHWSGGRVFVTDSTMAARTLLFDLDAGDWHPDLLKLFGIPRSVLPTVAPSVGRSDVLGDGQEVAASISDQASSVIASLGCDSESILVNLGTGGFVLMPVGEVPHRLFGYLCGPFLCDGKRTLYALEGTINGAGAAVDRFGCGSVELSDDLYPDAFCMPDVSGLGAPYWRADVGLTFSSAAQRLAPEKQRKIVMEGVMFRVAQIVQDLMEVRKPKAIVLSGGLANERFIRAGLATLLPCPMRMLDDVEATLRGAALLAANKLDGRPELSEPVAASDGLVYLRKKFDRWKTWVTEEVVG